MDSKDQSIPKRNIEVLQLFDFCFVLLIENKNSWKNQMTYFFFNEWDLLFGKMEWCYRLFWLTFCKYTDYLVDLEVVLWEKCSEYNYFERREIFEGTFFFLIEVDFGVFRVIDKEPIEFSYF